MNSIDWARLAAFIDGEGHISIVRQKQRHKYQVYYLSVSVANTSEDLMVWLLDNTKVGSVVAHHKPKDRKHKLCYRWICSTAQAASILRGCLPYFVVKGEQAALALQFQDTMGRRGAPISVEVIQRRALLYEKIHKLTATGQ